MYIRTCNCNESVNKQIRIQIQPSAVLYYLYHSIVVRNHKNAIIQKSGKSHQKGDIYKEHDFFKFFCSKL
jgi:hypothetical protein